MRQTVETLLEFWRPAAKEDELVDVACWCGSWQRLVRESSRSRGVRLVVEAESEVTVCGEQESGCAR